MANDLFDVDKLISQALPDPSLDGLFVAKLEELKLSKTAAEDILDVPYRTLKGILSGTQKTVDIITLLKIADFLQLPKEKVFSLLVDALSKHFPIFNSSGKKAHFIRENFDLPVLKKAGLISSLSDYEHIEERLNKRFGFRSILEYKKPKQDIAFSSGLFNMKNFRTRLFWVRSAIAAFEEIDNPHEYDKPALIKLFPRLSWYTMNVEHGLIEVMRLLYRIGITVLYLPNLQGLRLRGATLNVSGKPCIVLTNYQGFYSTLWFCLIHELFHVIFDWDEIKNDCYHLTDDDNEELTVREREQEADQFARDYLFAASELAKVKPFIKDKEYVEQVAHTNHVHPSIVYSFVAFDAKQNRHAWARVRKYSPAVQEAIGKIDYAWTDKRSLEEHADYLKEITYK